MLAASGDGVDQMLFLLGQLFKWFILSFPMRSVTLLSLLKRATEHIGPVVSIARICIETPSLLLSLPEKFQ